MPWARSITLPANLGYTAQALSDWRHDLAYHFASIDAGGEVLGVIGLDRRGGDSAELHYWIRSDHAGRGLTTEAAAAVMAWGFANLGIDRLTLWAGRDNAASRRVAEKLGFRHLGPLGWDPEGGLGHFKAERYEIERARFTKPLASSAAP
jgi:RimJ/RimL family protein N-acetyltransferase